MNRAQLAQHLAAAGCPADAVDLEGSAASTECYVVRREEDWLVYYAERGQMTGLRRFRTEDEACAALLRRVISELGLEPPASEPPRGSRAPQA